MPSALLPTSFHVPGSTALFMLVLFCGLVFRVTTSVCDRAANRIKAQTSDQHAEEAAATVHTPLLPRAQHAHEHFNGHSGKGSAGLGCARYRDSFNERQDDGEGAPAEKPADTQRRRQCEQALVETLRALVCPASCFLPV